MSLLLHALKIRSLASAAQLLFLFVLVLKTAAFSEQQIQDVMKLVLGALHDIQDKHLQPLPSGTAAIDGYYHLQQQPTTLQSTEDETATPRNHSSRSRLLQGYTASVSQCVWTSDYSYYSSSGTCDLNQDFVTTLPGSPTTESQKLLARFVAQSRNCNNYSSSSGCTADVRNSFCAWSYPNCYLGSAFYKDEWLYNRAYCPGSLVDKLAGCYLRANESSCTANRNCFWGPNQYDTYTMNQLSDAAKSIFSQAGADPSLSIYCLPKWILEKGVLNMIVDLSSSTSNQAALSLLQYLNGNCSGLTKYYSMIKGCTDAIGSSTCRSTLGCDWKSSTCVTSNREFGLDLLLDQNDPWVVKWDTATNECVLLANRTSCIGFRNITTNTSRYSDFITLQPNFYNGEPGEPGSSNAITTAPTTVIILFGLLLFSIMHIFTHDH